MAMSEWEARRANAIALEVLYDSRYSKTAKTAAGLTLSQYPPLPKKVSQALMDAAARALHGPGMTKAELLGG